jgi:uncharacterized protein (DUF1810 family)
VPEDPYNLARFVDAQEPVYADVVAELRAGRKRTHWMWFVFPQIQGLGPSETAQWFAIRSLDEARAYLAHPVLGARLRECTRIVLDIEGRTASEIFGYPDDLKFRSSLTLFARAAGGDVFGEAGKVLRRGRRFPDRGAHRMKKRPVVVTILAWLLIAAGAIGLVYHALDFRSDEFAGYVLIELLRALAIVIGVFLLRGQNWARWAALAWLAFHVFISITDPVKLATHVLLLGVYAWGLLRKNASEYFRKAKAVAPEQS